MIKLVLRWERNATKARLLGTLLIYVKQKLLALKQNLPSQQQLQAKTLDNAIMFRRMVAMRKTLKVHKFTL